MSEEKKPIPAKFKDFIEMVDKMPVLDLAELIKTLEDYFGVSAQAPIMAVAAGVDEGTEEEEKSSFNIELTEVGGNKIAVIKAVREITQLGLKESKDIVDAAR